MTARYSTLVDRVVNYFDPVRGGQRAAARQYQAYLNTFQGASTGSSALARWMTSTGSADADMVRDLVKLRERSRDLARNNPIAGGAISTIVARVVGTGLSPQPRPDRAALGWTEEQSRQFREVMLREFALAVGTKTFDIAERLDFYEQQDLVFRTTLVSGDAFTLLPMVARRDGNPYELRSQILEADRVGNPAGQMDGETLVQGVRLNPQTGAPEGFHVFDRHPGGLGALANRAGRWVDARSASVVPPILHHARILRPGQTRGIPHLAPVIEPLKQLGRYTDAEIMAAVVSGMFTVFVKSPAGDPGMFSVDAVAPAPASGSQTLKLDGGGMVVGLAPGEDVSMANPGRPNTAFDGFVMSILRQIGVALELPFEVLVKHFTASYSAARAALLDAWVFFRGRRAFVRSTFCQPIYEAVMAEGVAKGRIAAPGFFADAAVRAAYARCDWAGDAPGSLNPKDEIEAALKAIDGNLTTREQAEMELFGTDFTSTLDTKIAERRALERGGLLATSGPAESIPMPPASPRPPDAPGQDPVQP